MINVRVREKIALKFFLIFIFPNFLRNAMDFLINLYKK